jgi:hypothetical protein
MVTVVSIGLVMGGIQMMRRRGHFLVLARQHADMEAAYKRLKGSTTSLLTTNALATDLLTTDRPAERSEDDPFHQPGDLERLAVDQARWRIEISQADQAIAYHAAMAHKFKQGGKRGGKRGRY